MQRRRTGPIAACCMIHPPLLEHNFLTHFLLHTLKIPVDEKKNKEEETLVISFLMHLAHRAWILLLLAVKYILVAVSAALHAVGTVGDCLAKVASNIVVPNEEGGSVVDGAFPAVVAAVVTHVVAIVVLHFLYRAPIEMGPSSESRAV